MSNEEQPFLLLPDLCRRWRLDSDRVLDLALDKGLALWITFFDVFVSKSKPGRTAKSKPASCAHHERIDLRPSSEMLAQLRGRSDRMLIAAELPCLDDKGKAMLVTNPVGEEWGETSMIGLQPNRLYARMEDVYRFEEAHGMTQPDQASSPAGRQADSRSAHPAANTPDHPCYSEALDLANQCWMRLFAQGVPDVPATREAVVDWIRREFPGLNKKTAGRIARVIFPGD